MLFTLSEHKHIYKHICNCSFDTTNAKTNREVKSVIDDQKKHFY